MKNGLSEKEILIKYYDEILNIMNTLKVGVFITDGDGNVLMLNKESERTGGGMKIEDILGKNMTELQDIGYVDESSVLKAIETKKECRMIQKVADGSSIYLTAVPYHKGDDLELVICTERDITETKILEKILDDTKKLSDKQARELEYLRKKAQKKEHDVIAESENMKLLFKNLERVAHLDTTVLISGESGVGKEVVADYIHRRSERADKPFIKVNCAAIPDNLLESEFFGYEKGAFTGADAKGKLGIFELANEGTLFLDEVTEIPLRLQAKFLRVLQEREFMRIGGKKPISIDVRIIAATNTDMRELVDKGEFRKDLYYRLNVVPIEIPPLRERKEDIKALSEYFTVMFSEKYNIKKEISLEAMEALMNADWRGNVRELRNIIERLVVSYDGDVITGEQVKNLVFPESSTLKDLAMDGTSLSELVDSYEKEVLTEYMKKYNTAAEVARKLHVDKSTIGRKLRKYNLLTKE